MKIHFKPEKETLPLIGAASADEVVSKCAMKQLISNIADSRNWQPKENSPTLIVIQLLLGKSKLLIEGRNAR
jgi:hypothetical protein